MTDNVAYFLSELDYEGFPEKRPELGVFLSLEAALSAREEGVYARASYRYQRAEAKWQESQSQVSDKEAIRQKIKDAGLEGIAVPYVKVATLYGYHKPEPFETYLAEEDKRWIVDEVPLYRGT